MTRPADTAISILIADDDPDDRLLIKEALAEARLANDLQFVTDGVELMDFLHRRGEYADQANARFCQSKSSLGGKRGSVAFGDARSLP